MWRRLLVMRKRPGGGKTSRGREKAARRTPLPRFFFWDRRIGWNPKGLRRKWVKGAATIALAFLRKVKSGGRMRRVPTVAATGHDARGCYTDPRRRKRG
jgi:hypothetical protein